MGYIKVYARSKNELGNDNTNKKPIGEKMKVYYKSGYKYQLYKRIEVDVPFLPSISYSCRYFSLGNCKLYIFDGYAWDGPSGPTFDTKSTMRASLVHDVIYQMMAYNMIQKSVRLEADKLLYKMMIEDGAWKWRAKLWLKALKWFGKPERKKVLVSP